MPWSQRSVLLNAAQGSVFLDTMDSDSYMTQCYLDPNLLVHLKPKISIQGVSWGISLVAQAPRMSYPGASLRAGSSLLD